MILAMTLIIIILLYACIIQWAVIRKYRERDASLKRMFEGELENSQRFTGMYLHTYIHGQTFRAAIQKALNDFDGKPNDTAD